MAENIIATGQTIPRCEGDHRPEETAHHLCLDGEPAENDGTDIVDDYEQAPLETEGGEFRITQNRSVFNVRKEPVLKQTVPNKKPVLILDDNQNITELEQVPAFKRKEARYKMSFPADVPGPSKHKIEEKNGQQRLSTDNSYIHQTQD